MKKLFLLLAFGSLIMNAGAQECQVISVSPNQVPGDHGVNVAALHKELMQKHNFGTADFISGSNAAERTTFTGGRWYDYGVYMSQFSTWSLSVGGDDYVFANDMPIWNDTFGIIGYTSGPGHLNMVSVGNILQPQFAGFNDVTIGYLSTQMKVGPGDAYVVDSVIVPGDYFFGTHATAGVIDTLRLAFVTGNGSTSSSSSIFTGGLGGGGHYGTDHFFNCAYDSVMNRGTGTSGGTPAVYMDIPLINSDTSSTHEFTTAFPIVNTSGVPSPISVTAGNFVGCTITFKSGQPGIFTSLPGDTIIGAVPPYARYNMFRPIVDYYTTTAGPYTSIPAADWAPYNFTVATPNADLNDGLFKNLPNSTALLWGNQYIPLWSWFSISGGAAGNQYPEVSYHITCTTCGTIPLGVPELSNASSVNAYPDPATDELNIAFSLAQATNVSVSLTNMVGQVVAIQKINNVAAGKAVFNTSALPDGIYIYTLQADGDRTTGRVVLAH